MKFFLISYVQSKILIEVYRHTHQNSFQIVL
jgi:hypothetical protein